MSLLETYWEKDLIINNRELQYSGRFKAVELFTVINTALTDRGYEKREKKSEETVQEEGKKSYVELRPYKMRSNYIALMIKIKISLENLTETVEEMNSHPHKFQKGDMLIVFDAWVMTDQEARWGTRPFFYFLKGVFNKFVYTFPLEGKAREEVSADTAYIYGKIRQLLKSYSEQPTRLPRDEDVRRQTDKEIDDEISRGPATLE